jgi:chemotaxis protein methyltransferase CheR
MQPFLRKDGKHYVLAPEVRQQVRLGHLNLALDTWPSAENGIHALDIIFCRNVLIYFTRSTIEGVARRLYESLAEGGFLIMGPSDPSLMGLAPLEPVLNDWGLAWRRPLAGASRPTPSPAAALVPPASLSPPPVTTRIPSPPTPAAVPAPVPPTAPQALEAARQALARGNWREAARLASSLAEDPRAAVLEVRALANLAPEEAARACARAVAQHPLSAELRYLEALLLLGAGRLQEAERAARQALYLEPSLAMAYLTLGHVLQRLGDEAGALRAFRTAERLCAALPEDTPVLLAEGERAGALAEAARRARIQLEAAEPSKER